MKEDLPYFPHDNNTYAQPKMEALIAQYGIAGYGRFWILNEMIAASKNVKLDINKKVIKLSVCKRLELKEDEFNEFIEFLADPEIDIINFEAGIITTERTQEVYEIMKSSRGTQHEKYEKRKKNAASIENEDSPGENIQNKIKENRIEDNKNTHVCFENADVEDFQKDEEEIPFFEPEPPEKQDFAKRVFAIFTEAGLPNCKNNFVSFLMRDFRLGIENLERIRLKPKPEIIIPACKNYAKILALQKEGKTWWSSRQDFEHFCKDTIRRFTPENFRVEDYMKRETRGFPQKKIPWASACKDTTCYAEKVL